MKKKIFLLFLFLLLSPVFCLSQAWDLRINKSEADQSLWLIPAIEDSWGNYVLGGFYVDVSDSIEYGWLVKVSPAGDTLLTKRFTPPVGSSLLIFSKIYEQFDGYLVFGASNASDSRSIVVTKVDFDFNQMWIKRYGSQDYNGDHFMNVIVNSQNNYVGIGFAFDLVNNGNDDLLIYELDMQGDSLRSVYYPFQFRQWAYDIAEIPGGTGYKAITEGTPGSPVLGGNEIVTLDNNFNILSVLAIDSIQPNVSGGVFRANSDIRFLNDSVFLAYGRITYQEYWWQPVGQQLGAGVLTFDLNDTLKQVLIFGKPDTSDVEASRGLDYVYKDAIYAGCTANYWDFPDKHSEAYYNLNKLDSTGVVLWRKYYGGDDYYRLWSVKATQDGGCLMIGTINDSAADANVQYRTDVYIIKVGPDGVFVPGIETTVLPEAAYKIYPNPASSSFTIQGNYALPAALELYDLTGRQVHRQAVTSNRQQVDVNQLAGGLYVYRLVSGGKAGRGKIILK